MDCVWMLGKGSQWHDWELRYSMRSALANCPDAKNFWIIGFCPDFIDKELVNHIPHPDTYQSSKDANLINKAIRISMEPGLTEEFVLFSDDQFILKPTRKNDFHPYHEGDFKNYNFKKKGREWLHRRGLTYEFLKSRGKSTWAIDAHIPYPCNKKLFPHLLQTDYGSGKGYVIFSLYYNWIHLKEYGITEPIDISTDRIRGSLQAADRQNLFAAIDKFKENRFLNYDDKTIENWIFAKLIENRFPEPAPWEKDGGRSAVTDDVIDKAVTDLGKRMADMNKEVELFKQLTEKVIY